MPKSYENETVCVVDNGLFVEIAALLSQSFGKTYYYSPWEGAFPKSNSRLIGMGIPGVTRTNDYHEILEDVTLWCFPDVYWAGLQLDLESRGYRVWGSRRGEFLELDRVVSKEHLKSLGLAVGPYEVVKGLDNLRKYLKEHKNQWVKTSLVRGDFETFHSVSYSLIEPVLDELEHKLGKKKSVYQFICEDDIPDALEVGYDGYTIDGEFPSAALNGIEVKDKGYLGRFQNYEDMLPQIREVNDALAPTLKQFRYRNFIAVEMRIDKDGIPWIIDPCCRMGSPPGELVQAMYTNLADIFWYGAEGILIDPEPAGEWGAELLLHSAWADSNWQSVQIPKSIEAQVKLRDKCVIQGETYVVPMTCGLPEIGAVVAVGDTPEEAMEGCQRAAEKVKGYFIEHFPEALDEALEETRSVMNADFEESMDWEPEPEAALQGA